MDLIIPTLWKVPSFPEVLQTYAKSPEIGKIIIIDNDYSNRPTPNLNKVEYACFGRNIFVNPAWNEGYWRSSSDILGILNDDIVVDPRVFQQVANLNLSNNEILGFDPAPATNQLELESLTLDPAKPVGSQWYGFGTCMFMQRRAYAVIPDLYQVWFGDDYLCHNVTKWSRFRSCLVNGEMSKTISAQAEGSPVQNRILLDTDNAYRYLIRG